MKKIITIIIISLLTLSMYSQTVKKEYYDYRQTQIMAQYQVNSVGEKHGWFKGYDKQGVLIAEYNFKNNLWEGLNKEYSTWSGSRQLTKSETYKAGVLNGPAIYYMEGTVVEGKGNYINGEKDGKWYRIYSYSYDDIKRFHEIDGKLKDFVSSEDIYSMGKVVNPENGEVKEYFYPSKKLRSIVNYKESYKFGKNIWYYPTGAIETEELFEEKGHLVYSKTYYINGNLKESRTLVNNVEVFEAYYKDGSPTRATENILLEKQKYEAQVVKKQKYDEALIEFKNKNYSKAYDLYKEAGSKKEADAMWYLNSAKDYFEKLEYNSTLFQIGKAILENPAIEKESIIIEFKEEVYTKYLPELNDVFIKLAKTYDVDLMYKWLVSIKPVLKDVDYLRYEKLTNDTKLRFDHLITLDNEVDTFFANFNKMDVYSKNKLELISKSKKIIVDYINVFRLEKEYEVAIIKGKKVVDSISIILGYDEDKCKQLKKELKDIDNPEQIKAILKI